MRLTRRRALLGGLGLAAASLSAPRARAAQSVTIGYQRYGSLVVVKESGLLDRAFAAKGIGVHWAQFPAGPPMLEAMIGGSIDYGSVGDCPPVFAQATSPDTLVYIGHEPRNGHGEAILTRAGSSIRSVSDLRGKTVGVARGSNAHWLLLAQLLKHGLAWSDIHPVFLLPAAGRSAYASGQLDAWAVWDPYLSSALDGSRIVATAEDVDAGVEFYIGRRGFASGQPELLKLINESVVATDEWAQANRDKVVDILTRTTGLDRAVVQASVEKLPFSFQPITPDIVAQQQHIADSFFKSGGLPAKLDIRQMLLAKS